MCMDLTAAVVCSNVVCCPLRVMCPLRTHIQHASLCSKLAMLCPSDFAVCPAVRTAAFGVRAAYTVRYRPALAGTWLAFNNAGFGANIATLCLALGTWWASVIDTIAQ